MPTYEWKCVNDNCSYTTTTEQNMVDDLVYPDCSDHGRMQQDYNFGVAFVSGAGSTPARPSKGNHKKPKPNIK